MKSRTFTKAVGLILLSFRVSVAGEVPFERVVIDERPPASPWYKMAGDLNGNGWLDIIVGGSKGPLVWYAWPDWRKRQIADGGWNGVRGMTGDIDGDGHIDILMGGVVWFRNPGKAEGRWTMHRIDNVRTHDALLVDLNTNGRLDVVGRDQSAFGKTGNAIYVYRQESPEQWTKRVMPTRRGHSGRRSDGQRSAGHRHWRPMVRESGGYHRGRLEGARLHHGLDPPRRQGRTGRSQRQREARRGAHARRIGGTDVQDRLV